ncbi:translocation/assembly module TamB domain-containing protein [Leptolyngbya sp. CCNP1308]|uniref:translocation/assembly module TamB domain-containing protein n=1 Tax=Leptolyngbya sp. CCNP1308 TaxID=3110255 RepID=UPI002B21FA21|nr:translocation/assembly module TamB domain-containing protein [Leptolyngbya sp. CCNP1308]MEA5448304.1 translocation/assembly module TamB domain-containing protein [Leptolyngbya sp. CCNP1308]
MTHGSSPDLDPPDPSPRRRWLRALALVGSGLALGGISFCWWGYALARRELPQFLQRNLSDALGRPIKVGEFERFSPTGVRLGPSIVPPTEDDFSWVRSQSLEVNFNPLELLFTRTLRPSLIFIDPQVSLKQGFDGEWRFQPPQSVGEDGLFRTELRSIQIRNANLAIGPLSRTSIVELPEGVSSATLVLLENVNLRVRFSGPDNQTMSMVVGGRLNTGAFQIRGEGQIDTRQVNLAIQAQQLPIESVNPLLGGGLFVRSGQLSSNLDLKYRPEADAPLTVRGTARLRDGDIVLSDLPSALQDINGTLLLNGVGGSLENSSLKFGPILVKAAGSVDARQGHDMAITIPEVSLAQMAEAFAQPLPVQAAGQFQVETQVTGPLKLPQVAGRLANLGTVQIDRLGFETIAAQFGATLDGATLHQATLRPATGGTITAQGKALFNGALQDLYRNRNRQRLATAPSPSPDLELTAQTDLPLDGLAALYGLALPKTWRLGPLLAEARLSGSLANLQGEATWQLPQSTFPGRGRLAYSDRLITAEEAVFEVGAGKLQARAIADLNRRNWQATLAGDTLALGLVSPQLRGTLDTNLQASGSLTALNPESIRAQGQARFSHAVPLNLAAMDVPRINLAGVDQVLPGSLSTRFAWTGQRLDIAEATTPNLSAQGAVDIRFLPQQRLPQISNINLAARLSDINLGAAYGLVDGPQWLRPRGTLAFDGTLRGSLDDPRLAGTVGLRQVGMNAFTLVEAVVGPVQASRSTGVTVNMRGQNAEISASLAPDLRPNAFRLASGDFIASGQRRGNSLDMKIQNFDLTAVGLRPIPRPDLGQLGGLLNATAQIDLTALTNPAAVVQFALDRPALGTMGGDRLTGNLLYRDGLALLTGGSLQLSPNTEFLVTGTGRLFPQWQGQAEITTAAADFQDILRVLSLYSYADVGRLLNPLKLGRAEDLSVSSVGDADAPLLDQAELAQVLREMEEERADQRATALLPALDQLEGRVAGTLGVKASQTEGLAADFEFTGQNWAWGRYDFDNRFLARGQLRDRVLSLDPVEFRAGDTRLSLVGDLSPQNSDLAIAAGTLPLTAAATLLESPVEVTGLLNLNAHLTGPYTNPDLVGQLAVAEASVNRQPLTEISSGFEYQDAVLNVEGRVVGSAPEPLTFAGTIPYALPFMAVRPASDQMSLEATLKDDALSLVNLFTPALAWGGGSATVDLRLGGTPRRPLMSGLIAFDDASFVSPWLGASLDDLTGAIQLQGTQVRVESLTGSLFDGSFTLAGQLPLIPQDAAATDAGLSLALADINFNYANEVRSRVNGELSLTRALLAPTIGGQVQLQNTQVAVGRELTARAREVLSNPTSLGNFRDRFAQVSPLLPVQFNNLRVSLDSARVKALPILSLGLTGDVALSGSVPEVSADGAIYLTDGWINTITAEFFLASGRENVVRFRPEDPLDPHLDLVLEATVPLQRQYSINTLNSTTGAAEIPDLNRLAASTILDELQIEARVHGQASRLVNGLTLTSNPPYSQDQLLGMVTGGSLAGLGGAEPGLALGSNLLAAFTADSQDAIARSLGLRRLRLIGTTVLPTASKDTLGFGVGATVGISENLSATLVQVLNQNQPLALTARYRISDRWSIGGSTDVNNQGRGFVEYRVNFR